MEEFPFEEIASAVSQSEPAAASTDAAEPSLAADPSLDLARVREPLQSAMRARGFTELTAVQVAVLDAALQADGEPRDLSITSQTGSGKTVAIGLVLASTLLDRAAEGGREAGPRAVVIVPTRELANQLAEELGWLFAGAPQSNGSNGSPRSPASNGVKVDCVTGGTSTHLERKRLARAPRLLIGTPGRLLDHLESGALDLGAVRELVLDEADQMLDMGFREELEAILVRTSGERRTHLMSATFPPAIRRLAEGHQTNPVSVEGTRHGVANVDIEHVVHLVDDRTRYGALKNTLLLMEGERTLVFVNTRADTAELADRLAADGFSSMPLSGELPQLQRTRTLAAFRAGTVDVLVATDVAARGLDVPDVGLVVHAMPAMDAEVYVHRSGRTGRAGKKGRSVLLAPARKERRVRRVLQMARVDVTWLPVPSAKSVKKELAKRERRRLYEAIDSGEGLTDAGLDSARRLLAERDPAHVVAVLLERAAAKKIAPVDVGNLPASSVDQRRGAKPRSFDRREVRPDQGEGYTSFSINWGTRAGATAKRILAHVCRRGGITSASVGAIRLHEHKSTIDVARTAAPSFEERTRARDRRDPHLFIERARFERPGRTAGGTRAEGIRTRRTVGAR